MGLFKRSETTKRQANGNLDNNLEDALSAMISGMDSSLQQFGIHLEVSEANGSPIRDRVDCALKAFDKGIRQLELKEDIALDVDKGKVAQMLKRLKKMRDELASLAEIHEKLAQMQDRRR